MSLFQIVAQEYQVYIILRDGRIASVVEWCAVSHVAEFIEGNTMYLYSVGKSVKSLRSVED